MAFHKEHFKTKPIWYYFLKALPIKGFQRFHATKPSFYAMENDQQKTV